MQTQDNQVEVSAELQHKLELLRQAWSLPSATVALELLISAQLDRTVYEMTGIRPGLRLVVDNRPAASDQPPPGTGHPG